jgi:hypothetical protein
MDAAKQQAIEACIRCSRPEDEHLHRDEADELQRRIWKALGAPCAQFTDTPAQIFAENQAATSRWATRRRQPARPASQSGAPPDIAHRGAAMARQVLTRTRQHDQEAS